MSPFRRRRSDTLVRTIENQYGIDLNTRGDTKLGNLLQRRGFGSLSQLMKAYHGDALSHARRRKVFISYHYEDLRQVQGLRLMLENPNVQLSLYDQSVRQPVDSEKGAYVRSRIKPMIRSAEVLLCCIGNGTAYRDWVDWEIRVAKEGRIGICGVRLKGARGRTPPALVEFGSTVSAWSTEAIIAAVEQAAARRS